MTPAEPLLLPDLSVLDSDALKALVIKQHTLVIEQHAELVSNKNEIDSLKLLILKLKRMQFGPSSEKLAHHIEQLELRLEDLEINRASAPVASVLQASVETVKPVRRPLSAELPRENQDTRT